MLFSLVRHKFREDDTPGTYTLIVRHVEFGEGIFGTLFRNEIYPLLPVETSVKTSVQVFG